MRTNADYQLVRDGRLGSQQPRDPADLRVSSESHVVESKDELLVREANCLERYLLNRHALFQKYGLGSEIRIVGAGQFLEVQVDLHDRQVPFEPAICRGVDRLTARGDVSFHRRATEREHLHFRGLECILRWTPKMGQSAKVEP